VYKRLGWDTLVRRRRRGWREEEEEGQEAGVQNQKQEPHIKMWGKNNQFKQTSNKSDKVKKQQYNQENKTHTINKKNKQFQIIPKFQRIPKN
jgi:hypothetical protein